MPSDIEIAQSARLQPIVEVARGRLGLDEEHLVPYGRYKAKLSLPFVQALHAGDRPPGRLVLVTAISPTPAGEGKTTTTVGLGDALNRIGARTAIALREPSLGPVFGVKGGAAGGGYAQVVPMEDINLHFTGDFGAVALAHNLLAACIDNHVHHGNALGIDVRRIGWRRVMDLNDRALRRITVGLGGPANGFPREEGFDIIAASEVMAILCLATSLADLKRRLGDIVVAETTDRRPVRARDLKVQGAMAVLLKDAIAPNLVQTLEGTPAFVHGGPFGNIAHGCNSVMATRTALRLADWVVTEAGFGSDLGAEKFIDIKCRSAGLAPCAGVVVATVRALKYHGGIELPELGREDVAAVARGSANLERHVRLVRDVYGLPCAVALNHFVQDAPAEIEWLQRWGAERGVPVVLARHWAEGGKGAEALAREVVRLASAPKPSGASAATVAPASSTPGAQAFVYDLQAPLSDKLRAIAQRVYGAADIALPEDVRRRLDELERQGYGGLPVCVAKTQYSFSADPRLRGAATGHVLPVREVRLAAGAGFVVMVCGDIMTMPGLPKVSAAERIDIGDDGRIVGLD